MVRFAGVLIIFTLLRELYVCIASLDTLASVVICIYYLDYFSANITLLNFRCKSGNCSVNLLQNISECYCCCELEGCEESLKSDLVLQDLAPDSNLTCITEHPGFQPVCLQKWSLR